MIKKGSRVRVLQGRYKGKVGIIEHYHTNGSQPTIYVTLPDPKENVLFRDLSLLEEIPEEQPSARDVAPPIHQNKVATISTNELEERIKSLEAIVSSLPTTTALPIKLRCLRCGEIHDPPSDTCSVKALPLTDPKAEIVTEQPAVAETGKTEIVSFNPRLTACVDCQHQISLSAESCPNCGRYIQTLRPMLEPERAETRGRRWWVITILQALLAASFILYLIGLILVSFIK